MPWGRARVATGGAYNRVAVISCGVRALLSEPATQQPRRHGLLPSANARGCPRMGAILDPARRGQTIPSTGRALQH
eukprot:11198805-Lingulodinium_polyedra.AAC.1